MFYGDYMEPEELEKKLLELDEALKKTNDVLKAKDEEIAKMKERNDQLVNRLLVKQEPPQLMPDPIDPQQQYEDTLEAMASAIRDRYIKQE